MQMKNYRMQMKNYPMQMKNYPIQMKNYPMQMKKIEYCNVSYAIEAGVLLFDYKSITNCYNWM